MAPADKPRLEAEASTVPVGWVASLAPVLVEEAPKAPRLPVEDEPLVMSTVTPEPLAPEPLVALAETEEVASASPTFITTGVLLALSTPLLADELSSVDALTPGEDAVLSADPVVLGDEGTDVPEAPEATDVLEAAGLPGELV